VQYYSQAIGGEYQILRNRKPIATLMSDPSTSGEMKQKFTLVTQLCAFAQSDLKLPIDKHYQTYVDLHRRFAVWNVHAAPEFSLEPKKWWYPFVGSLKYRGYFSEKQARRYAEHLEKNNYDVYVEGVEAYSTLGWFADPLLNTFISNPDSELAEIVFHELAHQRLFFSGDTDFNEAFATAVAEEGVRRWYRHQQDSVAYERYLSDLQRNQQFVALVMRIRRQLEQLYVGTPATGTAASAGERETKSSIVAQLRQQYEELKRSWSGYSGYDGWFAHSLNNAQLNTIAVYYELVPGFQALLQNEENDLEAFFKLLSQWKRLKKEDRHLRLQELAAQRRNP
jgi:predicted aminopeptidase